MAMLDVATVCTIDDADSGHRMEFDGVDTDVATLVTIAGVADVEQRLIVNKQKGKSIVSI